MALDLGELAGTMTMDISPLLSNVGVASKAIADFATRGEAQAKAAGQGIADGMTAGVEDIPEQFRRAGAGIEKGVADGVQGAADWLRRASDAGDAEAQRLVASFKVLEPALRAAGNDAGAALAAGMLAGTPELKTEGREAGQAYADGFRAEVRSSVKDAAQLAGAAAGVAMAAGVADNLNLDAANRRLVAQLGMSDSEIATVGRVNGQIYADNFGDNDTIPEAIRVVVQNIDKDINSASFVPLTEKLLAVADTMNQDLGATSAAVGQMIRTGLVDTATQGLDVLTVGLQGPANKADDLMDTFNEYSVQFARLGLDGAASLGLISQAVQAGARDSDVAGDALKEFSIRAVSGSAEARQGFRKLGLDGKAMAAQIAAGGPEAAEGLDTVLDRLRAVKDPADQARVATLLFGTQSEDMAKALLGMDLSKVGKQLGDVAGAAQKVVDTTGGGAQATIDGYRKRIVDWGRGVIESTGPTAALAGAIAAVGPAAIGVLGPVAQIIAARGAQTAAAGTAAAAETAASGATARGWVMSSAAATAGGVRTAAAWVLSSGAALATAVAATVVAVATTVGGWALMGAQALLGAAKVAAAWLIALGPIGLAIAAIVAVGVVVYKNWDRIKAWTAAAWGWIVDKVKVVPGLILSFFMNWTLPGLIFKHWDKIRSTTINVATAIVAWVKGLPGRFVDAMSSLGSKIAQVASAAWGRFRSATADKAAAVVEFVRSLPGKIKDVFTSLPGELATIGGQLIDGLVNGLQAAGHKVADYVASLVNKIPKKIRSLMGIASPSKVMHALGRWMGIGLANGLVSTDGVVSRAAKGTGHHLMTALEMVEAELKGKTKELEGLTAELDGLKSQLSDAESLVASLQGSFDSLSGTVAGAFKADMFGGNTVAEMLGIGQSNEADLQAVSDALVKLKGMGGDSGFLSELFQKGKTGLILELAAGPQSQLTAVQDQYAANNALAKQLGDSIAEGVYGQQMRDAAAEVTRLSAKVATDAVLGLAIARVQGEIKDLQKFIKELNRPEPVKSGGDADAGKGNGKGGNDQMRPINVYDRSGDPVRTAREVARQHAFAGRS